MGEVIHVNFSKNREDTISSYLESLRDMGIDEEDVLEVQDAINDLEVYMDSDEDIKIFANSYLEKFL